MASVVVEVRLYIFLTLALDSNTQLYALEKEHLVSIEWEDR